MWNQDLYQKAIDFAARAHGTQPVPGKGYSYVVHLANVAAEIGRAICAGGFDDPDLAIQCALLHDVIEDTITEEEELGAKFGEKVLAGVLALTKDKKLPPGERMADSLKRIQNSDAVIACVKLADRITNLQPPPAQWDRAKRSEYLAQAETILEELGHASVFLAERLKAKIEAYKGYL